MTQSPLLADRAYGVARRVVASLLMGNVMACGSGALPSAPLRGAELARGIDDLAEPLVGSGAVLGLSIAVTRGDSVLFAQGYGHEDLARTRRATEHSVYWIASVTKLFVAATMLRLDEDGVLALDRPLLELLPELGDQWRGVTLRHCLNHTSGIPDFVGDAVRRSMEQGAPADHPYVLAWTRAAAPRFAPGARWSYTNTPYHLAGIVAERATGEPFADLLDRLVLAPLGLTSTGFGFDQRVRGRWRVFQPDADSIIGVTVLNEYPIFTDGGLSSSALEVAAALRGLFDGAVVQPATAARMTRATMTEYGEMGYGLGVRTGVLHGHRKLGHTGGQAGILAAAAFYPDDSLSVVVLLNTDGAVDATELEARVARLALGLTEPSFDDVPLSTDQMKRLSGTFEIDSEGVRRRFERYIADGRLMERRIAPGAEPYALRHLGRGTFGDPAWGELRLTSSLDADTVRTIVETWGGFFGDVAYRVEEPQR